MNIRTRSLALSCALAFTTTAGASDTGITPPPIDSEQRANRAIVLADSLQYVVPTSAFTSDAFTMGEGARRVLLANITPAALARTPGGVTLPCLRGGTLTARSSREAPRDIHIEFQDCRPYQSLPSVGNGPMHLTLSSDSFVFEQVSGIRLGDANRDFVVTQFYDFIEYTLLYTWNYHLTLQGRIDWPTHAQADMVPDRSQFEIHGSATYEDRTQRPDQPPRVILTKYTADHVKLSTSQTYGNDFEYSESQTVHQSGVITQEGGLPNTNATTTFEFAGLTLSQVADFLAFTGSTWLDGGVRYTLVSGGQESCLNGDYLFRTKSPLRRSNLESPSYESGELVINRSAIMHLYSASNVPAGLPVPVNGMLIHLVLANGASYDYDTFAISAQMPDATQCAF